jgi:ArsR family transcriptional regulator
LKDKENSTIITNKIHDIQDANLILDILGNSTRRRILFLLSKEPLYFNQLSKIIGIGQQSILRHMKILEDSGLIETYTQESNLGAPNRNIIECSYKF